MISVFRGPLSGPIFVTSDANNGFGPNSRATFTATAGTTYTIGVSTLAGKSTGAFILNYYRGNSGGEIFLTTGAGWARTGAGLARVCGAGRAAGLDVAFTGAGRGVTLATGFGASLGAGLGATFGAGAAACAWDAATASPARPVSAIRDMANAAK